MLRNPTNDNMIHKAACLVKQISDYTAHGALNH